MHPTSDDPHVSLATDIYLHHDPDQDHHIFRPGNFLIYNGNREKVFIDEDKVRRYIYLDARGQTDLRTACVNIMHDFCDAYNLDENVLWDNCDRQLLQDFIETVLESCIKMDFATGLTHGFMMMLLTEIYGMSHDASEIDNYVTDLENEIYETCYSEMYCAINDLIDHILDDVGHRADSDERSELISMYLESTAWFVGYLDARHLYQAILDADITVAIIDEDDIDMDGHGPHIPLDFNFPRNIHIHGGDQAISFDIYDILMGEDKTTALPSHDVLRSQYVSPLF